MITAEHVKPGAAVVDVGVSRTEAGIVGDVDFDAVQAIAGAITPMPGGTGPMTIACLLENTLAAARMQGAFPDVALSAPGDVPARGFPHTHEWRPVRSRRFARTDGWATPRLDPTPHGPGPPGVSISGRPRRHDSNRSQEAAADQAPDAHVPTRP